MNAGTDASYDAVILFGFGGPEQPSEIRPFIERVLGGRAIPPERFEAVVSHYLQMGGSSPYNARTRAQADALQRALRDEGLAVPIEIAYRCADPDIETVLRRLGDRGATRVLGIILAPHQGSASWGRYLASVEQARSAIGPNAPVIEYVEPYFDHPSFVRAHVDRTAGALGKLDRPALADTEIVFTAHSIPTATTDVDVYTGQIARTAALVAHDIGAYRWRVAYQSRSGSPREPWLEPDIKDVIRDCAERGVRNVVVVPIGFLCDHVEVLYDLDTDARAVADSLGIVMQRAEALNDHPSFVRALALRTLERTCALR